MIYYIDYIAPVVVINDMLHCLFSSAGGNVVLVRYLKIANQPIKRKDSHLIDTTPKLKFDYSSTYQSAMVIYKMSNEASITAEDIDIKGNATCLRPGPKYGRMSFLFKEDS